MATILTMSFYHNSARGMKLIKYLVDLGFDFYPFVEFVYLSISLTHLNREFENYYRRLGVTIKDSYGLIASVRRHNIYLMMYIALMFMLSMAYGLSMVDIPRNWLVKHTFPVPTPLGPGVESVLGYLVSMFEYMIKNYIPVSASLYLGYYELLIAIKGRVLQNISFSTTHKSIYEQLRELDTFMDTFESSLSILPLNWLAYNVGPGLCYMQSFLYYEDDEIVWLQIPIFVVITCFNFIFIIFVLYLINEWQEQFDEKVNVFGWRIEEDIPSLTNFRLIDRVEKIMKRRVSVWHTFSIERSLILSYIGSALTFSVFFAKM